MTLLNHPPIPVTLDQKAVLKAMKAYAAVSEDGMVNLGGMEDAVEAYLKAAHPTPDREGLIEKLEALKSNWGGSNPWQEGYLKALDKAIAIAHLHDADMYTKSPVSIHNDGTCFQTSGNASKISEPTNNGATGITSSIATAMVRTLSIMCCVSCGKTHVYPSRCRVYRVCGMSLISSHPHRSKVRALQGDCRL